MAMLKIDAFNAKIKSIQPWMIVVCGMIFYCFNYYVRISPSVMQPQLSEAFHINATQFGTLAAFYYYAYTSMQIPAGMIYDKYGVRMVLSTAFLTAIIGLAVFSSANNYYIAACGRLLIGLGCAFAYIGTLKLASIWLPSTQFGMIAGLTTAVGMVSGALSQKYLSHFVETVGYQSALKSSLIIGILLAIFILAIVRNKPNTEDDQSQLASEHIINLSQLKHAFHIIFTNPQMWLIGAIGCLIYLPSSIFLDLWGVPYLKAVYHLSSSDAVSIAGYTFYGWIIAGPVLGLISDKIKRRRLPLVATSVFAALLLCIIFYTPNINTNALAPIFFFIGFCCGGHSLVFALGKENNPLQISGTAVATTNMLIMLGGVIFQPVVGKLIDLHTNSLIKDINGLPVYTSSDYTFALSIVPIGVTIGVILCFFLKETFCESQAQQKHEELFTPKLQPINIEDEQVETA